MDLVLAAVAGSVGACSNSNGSEPTDAGRPSADATVSADSGASAVIGTSGGTLVSSDGRVAVSVPAGALKSAVKLTIERAANPPAGAIAPVYDLEPDGTTFSIPVTLSMTYDPSLLGSQPSDVDLATWVNGTWQEQPGSIVTTSNDIVTVLTTHFSLWSYFPVGNVHCGSCYENADVSKQCCNLASGTWDSTSCKCTGVTASQFGGCASFLSGGLTVPNFCNSCLFFCCLDNGGVPMGACECVGDTVNPLASVKAITKCGLDCFAPDAAPAWLTCTSESLADAGPSDPGAAAERGVSAFVGSWSLSGTETTSACTNGAANSTVSESRVVTWTAGGPGLIGMGTCCTFDEMVSGNTATLASALPCTCTTDAGVVTEEDTIEAVTWVLSADGTTATVSQMMTDTRPATGVTCQLSLSETATRQ